GPWGEPVHPRSEIWVVAALLADGADRTVAAVHEEVVWLREQLRVDALEQGATVAVREVEATYAAGEQGIAREECAVDRERHPARAVARGVQDLELERSGPVGLAGDEQFDVRGRRNRAVELQPQGSAL